MSAPRHRNAISPADAGQARAASPSLLGIATIQAHRDQAIEKSAAEAARLALAHAACNAPPEGAASYAQQPLPVPSIHLHHTTHLRTTSEFLDRPSTARLVLSRLGIPDDRAPIARDITYPTSFLAQLHQAQLLLTENHDHTVALLTFHTRIAPPDSPPAQRNAVAITRAALVAATPGPVTVLGVRREIASRSRAKPYPPDWATHNERARYARRARRGRTCAGLALQATLDELALDFTDLDWIITDYDPTHQLAASRSASPKDTPGVSAVRDPANRVTRNGHPPSLDTLQCLWAQRALLSGDLISITEVDLAEPVTAHAAILRTNHTISARHTA